MQMKRLFAAAMAAALLMTGCGTDQENSEKSATEVTDAYVLVPRDKDYTPLYAEPSKFSEKIAQMQDKKSITIYSQQGGYYYASYDGHKGYVRSECVAFSLTNVIPQDEKEDKTAKTQPAVTTAAVTTAATTTVAVTEAEQTDAPEAPEVTEALIEESSEEVTEAPVTDAPAEPEVHADPEEPKARYTVFICEDDILKAAGFTYSDHVDFCTVQEIITDNGNAALVYENLSGNGMTFRAMRGIRVTNVVEGTLTVRGKITLHRWDWADEAQTQRIVNDEKSSTYTFTMNVG